MSMDIMFEKVKISQDEFQGNLEANLIYTKSSKVEPEHILAALIQVKGSVAERRIKQQKRLPKNITAVLLSCVEDDAADFAEITELKDAAYSDKTGKIIKQITDWAKDNENKKIHERSFISLLAINFEENTVEALREFGSLNWDLFIQGLTWPPEESEVQINLWHPKTSALIIERAFDKTGKKVINILQSETIGLGMREYGVEALFIALITTKPSVLDLALRPQLVFTESGFNNTKDIVIELRHRLKRPQNIDTADHILKDDCHERLVAVLEHAAKTAVNDIRDRLSARDIAEAFVICVAKEPFGGILNTFGIDLEKALDFIESHVEKEEEEDENLVPLEDLEDRLKNEIVGQDHAIKRILPLIKRHRFGYQRPGKPAGVFLFMGPSGTGKTQLSKALAKTLYGSSDDLLMLEMGQFGTKESKSMFIGAPPGYVGYGEGKLTNGLRDKPECVILFDEIEKADPLVFDVLLRFLDEGKIDDPAGPVRNGSKCLIVLTSNFLADEFYRFEEDLKSNDKKKQEKVYRDLREELLNQGKKGADAKIQKFFRPEFIFRIDEILLFRSFDREDYIEIAKIGMVNEIQYIREHFDYSVTYDDNILEKIANECFVRKNEGARVVNRLINVVVVNPLIDYFVEHKNQDLSNIHISMDGANEQIEIRMES